MEMKYLLRRKQYTAALVCVGSWRVENKTITTAQCSAVKRCTIKIKITMTITLTITKTISKTITAAQCSQMLYNSLSLRSIGIHSLCDGVEKIALLACWRSHCLLLRSSPHCAEFSPGALFNRHSSLRLIIMNIFIIIIVFNHHCHHHLHLLHHHHLW